ncbi:MAG: hypothetical protein DRN14_00240 [Thermoplasmata archaeon]|nr:MAG: hypothetical protein DRN14_00240 [Thermoplasmata archaeon]
MKVVGYFTENTPYEHEAETLKLSLEANGYEYDIQGVPNLGSWQKNTQYKALVILSMLKKYRGLPILYLDVDAIMVHPPLILEDIDCDVAAVHFCRTNELLSGTLYFSGSKMCMILVRDWIKLNEQYPEKLPDGRAAWDQRTLEMAIKQNPKVRFYELPQEYTWITELTQKTQPDLSPVIMHTRGAKRFKNIINKKQKEEGYAV